MREFGDFQTPELLAQLVVEKLKALDFQRIFEPTCGTGNLLEQARKVYPKAEMLGIELQESHFRAASLRFAQDPLTRVLNRNIFDIERLEWTKGGSLLVLGNPPWVTKAELSRLNSLNLPLKSNKLGGGLSALTGESNFDLAEAVVLHALSLLKDEAACFAVLCKTSTASRLLTPSVLKAYRIADPTVYRLDAQKWFRAKCDACLLTFKTQSSPPSLVRVYPTLDSLRPDNFNPFSPLAPRLFRQGIKHDASEIFVLRIQNSQLVNRRGIVVELEPDNLFPLYNATDLYRKRYSGRYVIVTQRSLSDDTARLEHTSPKLWRYLSLHAERLDNRGSRVYRNRPRFAMFGVGGYAFLPYKVAVSGFHEELRFNLLSPIDGKPVMVDDTCYYIPAESLEVAEGYLERLSRAIRDNSVFLRSGKRLWTARILDKLANHPDRDGDILNEWSLKSSYSAS